MRLDSSADKADTSGEDGDYSQEVGKAEVDLKGDGKEAYGPWLIVKRKKAGTKSEGMRYTNQGVDVGPGRGHFRYDENSCKHVNKSHEKPPYDVRYGFDREKMEAGHRVSFSPPSFRVKKKINPLSMDQRPQSSKETHFHETEVPVFSFDVETNTKKVTSSCPSDVCVLGVNSFGGATILFGSVSNGKGDGRDGWPEQARMGNSPKGKNHGGISKHVGTNKSKSHHDMGLVRSRRDVGMAAHLPSNSRKQKEGMAPTDGSSVDGMGLPLVDNSIRQTNKGGSTHFRVESIVKA